LACVPNGRDEARPSNSGGLGLDDEGEGFEAEFGGEEGFGDDVGGAAAADFGAMFETGRAGDEEDRGLLVVR
jgi:hypothetical protein